MITRFSAKNYGCLKDVTCALTPLHAFIGPNDSGKSTLLRGLLDVAETAADSPSRGGLGGRYSPTTQQLSFDLSFSGKVPELVRYAVGVPDTTLMTPTIENSRVLSQPGIVSLGALVPALPSWGLLNPAERIPDDGFCGAAIVRFDADRLKSSSSLIRDTQADTFIVKRGHGLPGLLDLILNRGDDSFRSLVDRVRQLFPAVKTVRLGNVSESEKEVRIELLDGTIVPAAYMSEGLLYYLAYQALSFVKSVSALLIEEPETGLHPSRIAEIVRVLRSIVAGGVQVVMATHSPLVINELQPEEVSIVTRSADVGTTVTRIADTYDFASRAKVYALGELWLSYADADTNEAPLLKGGPGPGVVRP